MPSKITLPRILVMVLATAGASGAVLLFMWRRYLEARRRLQDTSTKTTSSVCFYCGQRKEIAYSEEIADQQKCALSESSKTSRNSKQASDVHSLNDVSQKHRFAVESLFRVIESLERALECTRNDATDSAGTSSPTSENELFFDSVADSKEVSILHLITEMKSILEQAYLVKENYKQRLLLLHDSYIPSDESGAESDSEIDSFKSATEYLDLEDVSYLIYTCPPQAVMFKAALHELEAENIFVRCRRTKLLNCSSDAEYIAKLHCIRQCMDNMASDAKTAEWLQVTALRMGRKLISAFGGDADEFERAYLKMLDFLKQPDAIETIRCELKPKGVVYISIYDVIFDFVLLDALEHLAAPPSTLLAVVGNRWLSDNFKKTALGSVIRTLIMTKQKLLENKEGYLAHFYAVASTLAPCLAWAFLGNDVYYKSMALRFKDAMMQYACDLFNSNYISFTTIEEVTQQVIDLSVKLEESLNCIFSSSDFDNGDVKVKEVETSEHFQRHMEIANGAI